MSEASIQESVGKGGPNRPADVKAVQALLNTNARRSGATPLHVDGAAGGLTVAAIMLFQRKVIGMSAPDGVVDPGGRTLRALTSAPIRNVSVPLPHASAPAPSGDQIRNPGWPLKPTLKPLVGNDQRANVFGKFDYDPDPKHPGSIKIKGDWEKKNIVIISVDMGPVVKTRRMQCHQLAAPQIKRLFEAWGQAGLLNRILSFEGGFVARYVRGSTTNLSNHSFGSAFDINYKWNQLGKVPALLGETGSVRELVPIANGHGFYWGGHFSRLDGMHFEIATLI